MPSIYVQLNMYVYICKYTEIYYTGELWLWGCTILHVKVTINIIEQWTCLNVYNTFTNECTVQSYNTHVQKSNPFWVKYVTKCEDVVVLCTDYSYRYSLFKLHGIAMVNF